MARGDVLRVIDVRFPVRDFIRMVHLGHTTMGGRYSIDVLGDWAIIVVTDIATGSQYPEIIEEGTRMTDDQLMRFAERRINHGKRRLRFFYSDVVLVYSFI